MPDRIEVFTGRYRFLSNFYRLENPIYDDTRRAFRTVENAYQAYKTFDRKERGRVAAMTAVEAKHWGTALRERGDQREDWYEINLAIMLQLGLQKYLNNPELRQWLLETDKAELIEGNNWGDTFFGVCRGKGENWHGRLLMQIREMFR
jgi:ribA/ribD-fused uncharacterized protein